MAVETKSKNENKSFIGNVTSYLRAVVSEIRKVSWPTREDVINLTRIVLLVTAVTSIGLGLLSIGLTLFLDRFAFNNEWILVIIFVAIAGGTWWSFRQGERKGY